MFKRYNQLLEKHPYVVQIITGGVLWSTADVLSQSILIYKNKTELKEAKESKETPESSGSKKPMEFDLNRLKNITLYGTAIASPIYALWYYNLEVKVYKLFDRSKPTNSLLITKLRNLAQGKEQKEVTKSTILPNKPMVGLLRPPWHIIWTKLLLDGFLFDPLYLTLFFTSNTFLEGKGWKEAKEKLMHEFSFTYLLDLAIWTPLQLINFRYVPVSYQALYVQSFTLFWNAYLSSVQYK
jgi:hypothetical protein